AGLSRFGYEEFLASGVIVMGITRLDGRLVRTLYVRKMRWSQMDPTIYTFDIQSDFGIVIKQPLDALIGKSTKSKIKADEDEEE
ncbi:MAG: ATPase domain-containing protein, partial [Nitrososphaerota archaeon]